MEATASPPPTVLTKSAFARMINVSPGRVSQYIAEGKISGGALDGEGRTARIVVEAALDQLDRTLSPGQRLGNGKATLLQPPAGEAGGRPAPAAAPGRSSMSNLTAARAETEYYRARKARLDYERAAGELVRVDELQRAATALAEMLVQDLERLPALADDLAGVVAKGGAAGLRARLREIIRDVRGGMARRMADLARPAEDDSTAPGEARRAGLLAAGEEDDEFADGEDAADHEEGSAR